ncbi:MAG: M3 family metallopeptidase, partial [Oceanihabitans sp.]|nr:M3 family metallopeptidase [Oceanihabitans sp.]
MKTHKHLQSLKAISVCVLITFTNCKQEEKQDATKMSENILTQEWTGPYQGVPAFDKMKVTDIKEAIEFGMTESLADIDKIANNTEVPNFTNTIAALEASGKTLDRVFNYYGILSSNMSSPAFRSIQAELAPKLSEYSSKITQNEKLFQRIKAVYDASQETPLELQEQRVVELTYKKYEMNGANLDPAQKERYAAINKELSSLYNTFSDNVLHDEENYVTYLNQDQLDGLSEGFIKSAAKIATDKGKDGTYAITNTRSSMDPFLKYATNRALRKQVWENYYSRGDNGDEFDNNAIIAQILKLRKERVALMGYDNYAEWRLQDRMAKTPENAMDLMMAVWPAAIGRVAEEVADMQTVANDNGDNITIEPWDYRFYAEKVRKKKYDLDSDEVKQYLQLDKLTEALFFTAEKLFNYKFTPVKEGSVPVFQEDVHVWEVTDKDSGKHIGLWYLDPFAREGKRSGAWATTYRSYTNFEGETNVLASNNSNFVKPAPGEAVLVSWDDATTFFHEFGHALHFFSS